MRFQCGVQSCFHEVSSGFHVVSIGFPWGFHVVSIGFPCDLTIKFPWEIHPENITTRWSSDRWRAPRRWAQRRHWDGDGNHLIYGHHFGDFSRLFFSWFNMEKKRHIQYFFGNHLFIYDLDIFRCPSLSIIWCRMNMFKIAVDNDLMMWIKPLWSVCLDGMGCVTIDYIYSYTMSWPWHMWWSQV